MGQPKSATLISKQSLQYSIHLCATTTKKTLMLSIGSTNTQNVFF